MKRTTRSAIPEEATKLPKPDKEAPTSTFEQSPLITPERLRTDWRNAFLPWPKWVRRLDFILDEENPQAAPEYAAILVGGKHLKLIHLALPELAVLFELTRLGAATIDTNSNFAKPVPQVYAKMHFRAAKRDLMSIRRILWNAGADEQTKAIWRADDYSVENTYSEGHLHPRKEARAVAMGHAKDHAEKRLREGTFPAAYSLTAYLENLTALFALVDQQRRA